MKIIALSDTHMPRMAKKLPSAIIGDLETADLIIHAGDWQKLEVLKELSLYARVIGVTGNTDSTELRLSLKERELFTVNDFTIGVVHGHGKGGTTEARALRAFQDDRVDCIIFGHSHIPVKKSVNGVLLFNPGSATDKRKQREFSYGKITLSPEPVVEHVFYKSKD